MLNNNSKEMKTVVETFIIEETAQLIYDNEKLEAWNKHVSELGLTGQTKIVKKDKSPIPFMYMNSSIRSILETLCPRKVPVETYDATPIPVEILDLVALSKKEAYFDRLEIWYDDKTPDPACVGISKKWGESGSYNYSTKEEAEKGLSRSLSSYNYEENNYLLGKWSDVKQSFEELKARAIKRFSEETINFANGQIKYYQRQIEDLQLTCASKFGAKNTNSLDELPF